MRVCYVNTCMEGTPAPALCYIWDVCAEGARSRDGDHASSTHQGCFRINSVVALCSDLNTAVQIGCSAALALLCSSAAVHAALDKSVSRHLLARAGLCGAIGLLAALLWSRLTASVCIKPLTSTVLMRHNRALSKTYLMLSSTHRDTLHIKHVMPMSLLLSIG